MIERFYAQYHDELTGWCRSMTGDPALAEDLVQEAFLRGLLNSSLLQTFPERQLRAWFYRTIRNLYLDRLRHARFETLPDTVPETGHLSEEYARIDWQQLLDSLPGEEGMLFGLRISPATLPVRSAIFSASRQVPSAPGFPWPKSTCRLP